jgi:hypothetical protein
MNALDPTTITPVRVADLFAGTPFYVQRQETR